MRSTLKGSLDDRIKVAARLVTLSFLGGSPLLRLLSRDVQGCGRLVVALGGHKVRGFCRIVDIRIVRRVSLVKLEELLGDPLGDG